MKLVVATTSVHKLREIASALDGCGFELLSLRDFAPIDEPEENETTMRGNARLKALHYVAATRLPALADDSGIEVDALGGEPGVRSSRWIAGSDAERTAALLERLRDVPEERRTARYRCALCLAQADGQFIETESTCEGRIAAAPRGHNGFGYDPVFEITEQTGAPATWIGYTVAEAPPQLKAQISHRARALQQLKTKLATLRLHQ